MPIDYKAIASQADDLTDDKLAAIAADADSPVPSSVGQGPLAEQPSAPGPSSSLSGIAHALAAPLGIPRNISDPAAQALLTTRQSLRDIDNPNRPLPPVGSRGRQLVEQGGVKGPGDVAGAMAKGAALQPPPSTSGGGGRLLADLLRDPSNPIGGGLTAAAGWGADELAGWLTTKAAEAEKAGSPDLARRFAAARDLLVKGETTAEDLLTDPLIAGGYLKGILGKAIPAGGQVFGKTIPGLETASRLAQRFSHLTAPPAILGGAADVGGKTVGAAQSAAEGGDPRLLAEALPEAAAQAAIISQSSPSEWIKNPSAAKPPLTLDERVGKLTNPPIAPEWAARWNEKLSRIPVAARFTSSRVGAYTNSGGLLKALGKESVAPEVVKTVMEAISTDPTLTKGEGTAKAPRANLSIKKISDVVEDSGLTTTDVVNVAKLLERYGFLKPQSAHFGKSPEEGAYTVANHGEWGYLLDQLSKAKAGPAHPAEHFQSTGQPLPVEVPPPPPKGPDESLPPIPVAPAEPSSTPVPTAPPSQPDYSLRLEPPELPPGIPPSTTSWKGGAAGNGSSSMPSTFKANLPAPPPPPPGVQPSSGSYSLPVPPVAANPISSSAGVKAVQKGGVLSDVDASTLQPLESPPGTRLGNPGAMEAELNRLYDATVKDSPFGQAIADKALEIARKNALGKAIPDSDQAGTRTIQSLWTDAIGQALRELGVTKPPNKPSNKPPNNPPPPSPPKAPPLPQKQEAVAPPPEEPPTELPPPPRVLTGEQKDYLKEKGIPVPFAEKLLEMSPDDALAAIKAHKTLGKLHGNAQLKILRTLFSADFAPPPGRGTHKIVTEAELKRPPVGVPSMAREK